MNSIYSFAILLVTISAYGTACVGGAFSWGAPHRLDACSSLRELLLTFILEAVGVNSAVIIHHTVDTAACCMFNAIWHVCYWSGTVKSRLFEFDITDFASSTVIIWWAGVVAASRPSCNGIKIKTWLCVRNRLSIDMFKRDLINWVEKGWSYLQQRGWRQPKRRGTPSSCTSWGADCMFDLNC